MENLLFHQPERFTLVLQKYHVSKLPGSITKFGQNV